jgi:AraC family transcriptional regulator
MDNTSIVSAPMIIERPAVATYPPGAELGPRTLEDFELVWVIAGRAVWTNLDAGVVQVLEPGTLMLTRPGTREHYRWDRYRTTRHGYVHFDVATHAELDACPLLRPTAPPSPLAGLLDYLPWLAEEPVADWREHAEASLGVLLALCATAPLPDLPAPPEHPALATALDHVRDAWAGAMRPFTLGEVAAVAGVSKEHLSRLFRERYGTGMITALEVVRLERAETLLARSNLRVAQIAATTGFDDPLYFSKRFRAAYGSSPRQYRQRGSRTSLALSGSLAALARRVAST